MKRDLGRFAGALIAVALFFGSTDAGEAEYYRGKTVRIIVGLSAGGGMTPGAPCAGARACTRALT